jgi:hypothetical protein
LRRRVTHNNSLERHKLKTEQYSRINSTKSPASRASKLNDPRLMLQSLENAESRVCVGQGVSAVGAVEVPEFVSLSCSHVTGRRTVRFVIIALKVVMQNDGDFADIILL